MNGWDILLLALLALAVFLAVRQIRKGKGRCACGCEGCSEAGRCSKKP